MKKQDIFKSNAENQWCPGCPNFSILRSFQNAFVNLDKSPEDICLVSGIGQAAKLPHYIRCNFFNGLHGRAIPVAIGIQAVNPNLTTIVVTGDGDAYGEGGNHFLHAVRRNPDITMVIHNNELYALTKGQASPTTPLYEKRNIQFQGVDIKPLNMPAIAILHGCGFVARGFAGDTDQLTDLLVRAVRHKGLSIVEVIQPCITWGTHSLKWYRERVRKLDETYDSRDMKHALGMAVSETETFLTGILYQAEPASIFGDRFRKQVTESPLASFDSLKAETVREILLEFKTS